jgi:hypothetical protein
MKAESLNLIMVKPEAIENKIARIRQEEEDSNGVCSSCKRPVYAPSRLLVVTARCANCISKDAQIEQMVRPDKTPRSEKRKALASARKQEKGRSTARI